MKLLIDADSLIYKAGCSNETREYLVQHKDTGQVVHSCQYKAEAVAFIGEDTEEFEAVLTKTAGELFISLGRASTYIEEMLDSIPLNYKNFQLYIGGEGNFRHELYPEYKATRDPMGKPIHEQEIRNYLVKKWKAEIVDGEEADDRVSYLCCADPSNSCIVGIDKDLQGTPGLHWNYDKKGEVQDISLESANEFFWTQMLTGDTSDNIPCLKGVGPKTAKGVIESCTPDMLADEVASMYKEHGHPPEYFMCMGNLLYLRRKPNQEWTPEVLCEL